MAQRRLWSTLVLTFLCSLLLGSVDSKKRLRPGWLWCFQDKCQCRNYKADCSGSELEIIPEFYYGYHRVTSLNFTSNELVSIPENFFKNVPSLTSLDLSNNTLVDGAINEEAFKVIIGLTELRINYNQPFRGSVEYLNLEKLVYYLPHLEKLDLRGTPALITGLSFFRTTEYVKEVVLAGVIFKDYTGVLTDVPFPKLEKLDLSGTFQLATVGERLFPTRTCFSKDPHYYRYTSTSLFPRLTHLVLRSNFTGLNDRWKYYHFGYCLPELKHLEVEGHFMMSRLFKWQFSHELFPKLLVLHLDNTADCNSCKLEAFVFNNTILQELYLSRNDYDISESFGANSLMNCPNLKRLELRENRSFKLTKVTQALLVSVTSIEILDLSYMKEKVVDYDATTNMDLYEMLTPLVNLRELYLAGNAITVIPIGAFDAMPRLAVLDLSNNVINGVHKDAFSDASKFSLQKVDLSGNPFHCDCDFRFLLAWQDENPSVFANPRHEFKCMKFTERPRRVLRYNYNIPPVQACILPLGASQALLGVVSFLHVILVTALYALRRHLKRTGRLSDIPRGWRNNENVGENNGRQLQAVRYEYDVFVSYAEGDADWVWRHLVSELERRRGLRICIHQRDFRPGRLILESIQDCITQSRQVLLVFSPHFAHSEWCQFELALCQRQAIERGHPLLVAYVQHVPERHMTPAMTAILRTCTYLPWSQDPDGAAIFWGNLLVALGH